MLHAAMYARRTCAPRTGEITRNINSVGWSGSYVKLQRDIRVRVCAHLYRCTRAPLFALVLARRVYIFSVREVSWPFYWDRAISNGHYRPACQEVCIFANETAGQRERERWNCVCAPIGYCEPRLNPHGGYQLSRYSCYSRWNRRKSAFPWFFSNLIAILFRDWSPILSKFLYIAIVYIFRLVRISSWLLYCHFEIERKCWFLNFSNRDIK